MVRRSLLYHGTLLLVLSRCCITAADIPWQAYHKTSQILESFKAAAGQTTNLARYQDIPDPDHNSDLSLPLITVTDFKQGEAGKEVILLIAGEHARELITSEIVYWLYQVLIGKDAEFLSWPAATAFHTQRKQMRPGVGTLQDWVQDLLEKVVFKIVPVENIAGRKAVEEGDTCLRRTFSGVDLNRNWGTEWKQKALDDEEYGGPHPFSEPESRIVKLIAESSPVRSFVNLHSGEYALYIPWDSHPNYAIDLPADTQVVLEQMNVWCQCMHGVGGAVAGYLAYGTSMDYMYERLHIPYPLTFEVYGPNDLGKLTAGGHPRKLAQQQPQHEQNGAQMGSQNGVQAKPNTKPQGQQQQQQPQDKNPDEETPASAQVVPQNQVSHGQISKEQLSQVQRSQEQHSQAAGQGGLKEQGMGGGSQIEGTADLAAQAVPIRRADCFADFNPPTVEQYQEVVMNWVATILTLADHLAAHPTASHAAMDAEQQQQPLPKGATHKMDLAQRIGSDEEQQLLRTAKDDLNITSAKRQGAGDEGADSATELLDNLQQHPQPESQEVGESLSSHKVYVYPLVLIVGCVLVFVLRKSTLSRLPWNRRRFYPSRYEV
ncbi:hypothetical protein ABBQ38_004221 [Trebouxia sp. C0009 RCD-2024]